MYMKRNNGPTRFNTAYKEYLVRCIDRISLLTPQKSEPVQKNFLSVQVSKQVIRRRPINRIMIKKS